MEQRSKLNSGAEQPMICAGVLGGAAGNMGSVADGIDMLKRRFELRPDYDDAWPI